MLEDRLAVIPEVSSTLATLMVRFDVLEARFKNLANAPSKVSGPKKAGRRKKRNPFQLFGNFPPPLGGSRGQRRLQELEEREVRSPSPSRMNVQWSEDIESWTMITRLGKKRKQQ